MKEKLEACDEFLNKVNGTWGDLFVETNYDGFTDGSQRQSLPQVF